MTNKDRAKRQDKRVSTATGFRVRPNSGAVSGHKGDLGGPDIFVETKTGYSDSGHLVIRQDWIDKAKKQAMAMGKLYWVLVISSDDSTDYAITDYSQIAILAGGPAYELPREDPDKVDLKNTKTLKLEIDEIDIALYYRRIGHKFPGIRRVMKESSLGIMIMYLDDFMRVYNERELYRP